MAAITVPGMFVPGDHASRPAATAVGSGTLYSCSTHSLIYQSDGATWSTWATLGETGSAAHIADAADAHDASAISIVDAGTYFTGTDVEAALQELGASGGGSVATDAIWDAAADTVVGTGANTAVRRKNNDSAAVAPTVNEDSGDGYAIGSRWLDTTADKEYVALDVTVGAAVWAETTGAGGAPAAHAASHENGGSDEIDVTGLTGAGGGGVSPARYMENVKWGAASPAAAAVTLPLTPTNGNKLIGIVIHNDSGTTNTTAITQTNVTWTLLDRYSATGRVIEFWIGAVAASAGTTATLTNSATGYNSLMVAEFAGLSGTLVDSLHTEGSGSTDKTMPSLDLTGGDMVIYCLSHASSGGVTRVPFGAQNRFYWSAYDASFKGDVGWAGPYPFAPSFFDASISTGYTYSVISID